MLAGEKSGRSYRRGKDLAEYEANSEGIMLWCPLNALLNSSTRGELAAAILAMTPDIAMHICIDNLSVVRK